MLVASLSAFDSTQTSFASVTCTLVTPLHHAPQRRPQAFSHIEANLKSAWWHRHRFPRTDLSR